MDYWTFGGEVKKFASLVLAHRWEVVKDDRLLSSAIHYFSKVYHGGFERRLDIEDLVQESLEHLWFSCFAMDPEEDMKGFRACFRFTLPHVLSNVVRCHLSKRFDIRREVSAVTLDGVSIIDLITSSGPCPDEIVIVGDLVRKLDKMVADYCESVNPLLGAVYMCELSPGDYLNDLEDQYYSSKNKNLPIKTLLIIKAKLLGVSYRTYAFHLKILRQMAIQLLGD